MDTLFEFALGGDTGAVSYWRAGGAGDPAGKNDEAVFTAPHHRMRKQHIDVKAATRPAACTNMTYYAYANCSWLGVKGYRNGLIIRGTFWSRRNHIW